MMNFRINSIFQLFLLAIFARFVQDVVSDYHELPFCSETQPGAILVSTLDGKFSKISIDGELLWEFETEPGPLLASNIHNLELTNNGQWIRIIPSLSGSLYKFDGITVDPIAITAESLLKSSFKYSDDLVMAGGIEVRTYGIGLTSGKVFYECSSTKCRNSTNDFGKVDDILVIKRTTQTVRAIEVRAGTEKWNFSVGENHIRMPRVSCIHEKSRNLKLNVTAILPEGLIQVSRMIENALLTWHYKFSSPIVKVWKWNGINLDEVDLFVLQDYKEVSPAIYIGMHERQLYVHESAIIKNLLENKHQVNTAVAESNSLSKIPWKPVLASGGLIEDDSTAMSVLYGSAYVNGNGYFLYTENDLQIKNTLLCENNITVELPMVETVEKYMILPMWVWWKEILVISLTTAIVFHMVFRYGQKRQILNSLSTTPSSQQTALSTQTSEDRPTDRLSESSTSSKFDSRYVNDFETVQCLGKGGFGVVFEVKQKIDECNYALKRITLPNEKSKRDRVMREVRTLAKLEHNHIVRYFNSWVEKPPPGWQQEHDYNFFKDTSAFVESTRTTSHKRSNSCSIVIENGHELSSKSDLDRSEMSDDFICFENVSNSQATITSVSLSRDTITSHSQKKINWKKPSRKSHSLDITKIIDAPIFLYIQMQLCKKDSLRDWLVDNQKRNREQVLDIFKQILSAVEYVHMQGLIHRDLKPSNIFFSLEGQIKVGDFGLVKDMLGCGEGDLSIPLPYSVHTREVGTRLYMSPEQLGSKKYDYKVDIYSLGLIFFELLVPFSTDMEKWKVLSQLKTNIFPKQFRENYTEEYELLSKMLCTNPKERLTTIGIKARAPISQHDVYGEDYHYELPNLKIGHK